MSHHGFRHTNKPGEAYIEWVGVLDSARGQGIGSTLLAWAEATARANSCHCLTLEVISSNQRAIQLYQRKGFTIEGGGDCCDECLTCCFVWCCMGCKYTGAHAMRKELP